MHLKHILKIPFRRGYLNANKIKTTRKGMNAIKQIRKEYKLYIKHILMINGIVLVSASVVLLSTKTFHFSKTEFEINRKRAQGSLPSPDEIENCYNVVILHPKICLSYFYLKKAAMPPNIILSPDLETRSATRSGNKP